MSGHRFRWVYLARKVGAAVSEALANGSFALGCPMICSDMHSGTGRSEFAINGSRDRPDTRPASGGQVETYVGGRDHRGQPATSPALTPEEMDEVGW